MTTQDNQPFDSNYFAYLVSGAITATADPFSESIGLKNYLPKMIKIFPKVMEEFEIVGNHKVIIASLHSLIDACSRILSSYDPDIFTDFLDMMLELIIMYYLYNYRHLHGTFPFTIIDNSFLSFKDYKDIVFDLDFRYFARSKFNSILTKVLSKDWKNYYTILGHFELWFKKRKLKGKPSEDFVKTHIPISRLHVIKKLKSHELFGNVPELIHSESFINRVCSMLKMKYRKKLLLLQLDRIRVFGEQYKDKSSKYKKRTNKQKKKENTEDYEIHDYYGKLWYLLSIGVYDEDIFFKTAYRVAISCVDLNVHFEEGKLSEHSEREILIHRIIKIGIKTVDNLFILRDYIIKVKNHDKYLSNVTIQLTKDIDNAISNLSEVSALSIDDELIDCFSKELIAQGFSGKDLMLNERIVTDIVNRYSDYQIRRKFHILVDVSAITDKTIQQLKEALEKKAEPLAVGIDGDFLEPLEKAVRDTDYESRRRFLHYRAAFNRMINGKPEINIRNAVIDSVRRKVNQGVKNVQDKVRRAGFIEFKTGSKINWNKRITLSNEKKNKEITGYVTKEDALKKYKIKRDEVLKKDFPTEDEQRIINETKEQEEQRIIKKEIEEELKNLGIDESDIEEEPKNLDVDAVDLEKDEENEVIDLPKNLDVDAVDLEKDEENKVIEIPNDSNKKVTVSQNECKTVVRQVNNDMQIIPNMNADQLTSNVKAVNANIQQEKPNSILKVAEEVMKKMYQDVTNLCSEIIQKPEEMIQEPNNPSEIIDSKKFSDRLTPIVNPEFIPPLLIQNYNLLYYNPYFPASELNVEIVRKAIPIAKKYVVKVNTFIKEIEKYLEGKEIYMMLNYFRPQTYIFSEANIYFMNEDYKTECECVYAYIIDCNLRISALEDCEHTLKRIKVNRNLNFRELNSLIRSLRGMIDSISDQVELLAKHLCPKLDINLDSIINREAESIYSKHNGNFNELTGELIDQEKKDYNVVYIGENRERMNDTYVSYLNYFKHTLRLRIAHHEFVGISPGSKRKNFYDYLENKNFFLQFYDMKFVYVLLYFPNQILKDVLMLDDYERRMIKRLIEKIGKNKNGIQIYLIILHFIFSTCSYAKGFMGSYNVNNFIHLMLDCELPFLYKGIESTDNVNIFGINYDNQAQDKYEIKIELKDGKKAYYSLIQYSKDTFDIPYINYIEFDKNLMSGTMIDGFYNVNLMSDIDIYEESRTDDIFMFYGFDARIDYDMIARQIKCKDGLKISNDVKKAFQSTKIFQLLTEYYTNGDVPNGWFRKSLKIAHWTCFFLDMNEECKKISYEMHVFNKVFRNYDTVDAFSQGLNPYLYLASFIPVIGYEGNNKKFIRNVNFFQVEYEITRLKLQLGNILPIFVRFYISENMKYREDDSGTEVIIELPLMRVHDFFLSRFVSPFYNEQSNDFNDFFEEYKTVKGELSLLHNFDFRFIYRIELNIDDADITRTKHKLRGKMLPLKITVENEILNDFSYRIQIYSPKTEDELKCNCFIWAIMNSEDQPFNEDELYKIKERYSIGFITKKDIRKFADTFKCKVIIKQVKYNLGIFKHETSTYVYNPTDSNKELKLGLIRYGNYSHYIPIFKTRISTYRLKDLDLESPLTYFYYDPNNSLPEGWRFADSFELFSAIIDKNYVRWLTWSENEDYNYNRGSIPVSFDSIKRHTLYQSSEIVIEKHELNKTKPIESLYVGDSETYVNEDKQLIPFCLCLYGSKNGNIIKESFYGEDCQRDFLMYCCEHGIRLIYFHNLKFDGWLFKEFMIRDMIYHGGKLYSLTILMFYKKDKVMITLKDSLALINSALRNFPKMFNLPNIEKELYPYNKITEQTVERGYLTLDECREEFNEEDFEKFIQKGKDLNYLIGDTINIKKLTEYYCHIDVKLLYEGLECFNRYCSELFGKVQGCRFLTISGLSYFVMKVNCFLNLPQYKGDIKGYIRQCIRGGRCMVRRNEKTKVDTEIVDFDACSLYPSAMSRLYLPKGDLYCTDDPTEVADIFYNKLMYEDQIEITSKRDVSAMILKVKVLKVGKERDFPLLNVRENGINMYTNDVEGREFYLTHIELQDFIKYQEGEIEFINCIYWKGDKDDRMANFIRQIYDLRVEYKRQGNPMQEVLKLFMNSSYGKTIQKDVNEEFKFLNKEKKESFIINNFERIKEVIKINSKTYWIKCEGCSEPLTIPCQIGALILGMSKRIMNEVICLAEDNNIDVYYQDTDSIHIKKCDVDSLARAFEASYGRPLTGSSMGQFHVDFPLINNKDTWSKQSIFLGKKCYIDCLINTEGDEQSFIRMKGIPEEVIRTTCKEIGISEYDLYNELYDGKEIDFNLLKKKCPSFEFLKDFGIKCKQKFNRKIKF